VEVSVEALPPSEAPKPAQKEARKEPGLSYIPLEPEAPGPKKKRS
jgi:hypothetical protein